MSLDLASPGAGARCPRCEGVELEGFVLPSDTVASRCPACRGVWCGRAELAELLEVGADHPLVAWEGAVTTRTEQACPTCADICLVEVRSSGAGDVAMGHCPVCHGIWIEAGDLPRLKARSGLARTPSPLLAGLRPVPLRHGDVDLRFDYDTPWVNGLALPVAFVVAIVVHFTPLRFLTDLFGRMPLHELGHATVSWFGGHFAFPLPFFTTHSDERSVLVALTLTVALLAAILAGAQERRRYLVWMGGAGLLIQAGLTLSMPYWRLARWITWAGCGGEIAFGTLLVVSFYYRLPDRLRWDFVRYLALAFGAAALVEATAFWIDVRARHDALPFGTAIGGSDDPNGDMNKLVGWGGTRAGIAAGYLTFAGLGLVVVAVHYGVFLLHAWRSGRGVDPREV
jgi:Zn-finger nucleic acid-binding protein